MPRKAAVKAPRPKPPVRREFSAGGLVYRKLPSGKLEFVLIRPKGAKSWALPKGHIEGDESSEQAAVREVREETGLEVGKVEPLGDVSYVFSWRDKPEGELVRVFKRVKFFLMEFASGDPSGHDAEIDEVAWIPADEAVQRATYKDERRLIANAITALSGVAT